MRGQAQILKSEAIGCQSTLIKLQEELISVKDSQAAVIQSSVKSSVKTAVAKSFSEALQTVKPTCSSPNCHEQRHTEERGKVFR
jgi:hypothetical protein